MVKVLGEGSFFGEVASLASQLEEDGARVVGTVLNEV